MSAVAIVCRGDGCRSRRRGVTIFQSPLHRGGPFNGGPGRLYKRHSGISVPSSSGRSLQHGNRGSIHLSCHGVLTCKNRSYSRPSFSCYARFPCLRSARLFIHRAKLAPLVTQSIRACMMSTATCIPSCARKMMGPT
jgi:hypothetical protein